MGRAFTYLAAVAAITANLLLPTRLVSYQPCCYDENGRLANCACENEKSRSVPILHDGCCEPHEIELRKAPAPIVTSGKLVCSAPQLDALLATAFATTVVPEHESPIVKCVLDTGPPERPKLLPLHCRFNI